MSLWKYSRIKKKKKRLRIILVMAIFVINQLDFFYIVEKWTNTLAVLIYTVYFSVSDCNKSLSLFWHS